MLKILGELGAEWRPSESSSHRREWDLCFHAKEMPFWGYVDLDLAGYSDQMKSTTIIYVYTLGGIAVS